MNNKKEDQVDSVTKMIVMACVAVLCIGLMVTMIIINNPSFETKREVISNITFKNKPKNVIVIETDKRTIVKHIGLFAGINWEKSNKQKKPMIEYMVNKDDSTDERKMKIVIPTNEEKKYSKEYAEAFSRTLVIEERENDK